MHNTVNEVKCVMGVVHNITNYDNKKNNRANGNIKCADKEKGVLDSHL